MPKLARSTPHAMRRINLNTKILPEVRSILEAAAEENGHSLSMDVEARLKASAFGPQAETRLREVIREEIRSSIREEIRVALAERTEADERVLEDRLYGPLPEAIGRYRY